MNNKTFYLISTFILLMLSFYFLEWKIFAGIFFFHWGVNTSKMANAKAEHQGKGEF